MSDGQFRTSDFALAAAMVHVGCHLDGLDKTHPPRAVFEFRRDPGLDEVIQQFWARTLMVDPLGYFQTQKALKAQLYAD